MYMTLHSCISVMDKVKINKQNKSLATGPLYVWTISGWVCTCNITQGFVKRFRTLLNIATFKVNSSRATIDTTLLS